ncbi:GTPase of the mitochondrial inner membrane that associates with the large ribosomal subunit [Dispira parvispora]|uniref:GTPase of the mitochondrial inner membrane that associates with the large ribosomal subunit n=1 Tax=Dispira parvispora TaxID=1520584 RepID=A0A9W8AVU9_9FUNG|nr:GTPase of the mitochondrial inner membrane that associates with the large ribosomal subunit [Dispira parvispora]
MAQSFLKKGGNFKDFRRIVVRGGRGGDGCVSFLREKYIESGPPNGGNGGHGGNVVIQVDPRETTLGFLDSVCRARAGSSGSGKSKHGEQGKDYIIKVPAGTVVREIDLPRKSSSSQGEVKVSGQRTWQEEQANTDESQGAFVYYPGWQDQGETKEVTIPKEYLPSDRTTTSKLLLDMTTPGQEEVAAKGGRGGLGNPYFATGERRSPKFALRGLMGEVRWLELELKTIADVGLVGLPNAGKSTFLRAVSNAHPKVAPYPFTTLNPYLGTVDYDDQVQLTLADIPGLIAGAHRNVGLGHNFLRHIERSHILVYVVDIGKENPWEDLATLQKELTLYSPELVKKPSLLVANKADITDLAKSNLPLLQQKTDIPVIPISAKHALNIRKVTHHMRLLVERTRPASPDIHTTSPKGT